MADVKLAHLAAVLEGMIDANQDITARGVVASSEGVFRHASDITRNAGRRQLLEEQQERQRLLRKAAERWNPQSRDKLLQRLNSLEKEVEQLRGERVILVAAVRAMIHSIGESGGMAAWRRQFPAYRAAYAKLIELGAVPAADVVPLPSGPPVRSQSGE